MKVVLNPKEEMTPLERSKAIAEGKDFDRIAMDPFLGEIKAKLINKNTREYWTNEDNLVNAEILAFNRYRADGMGVGPNAYGIAEAMGVIAHYPKQGLIYVEKHPIESIQEIDKLKERFDLSMDDDFNTADAISIIFELVKLSNITISKDSSIEYSKYMLETIIGFCDVLGIITDKKEEV